MIGQRLSSSVTLMLRVMARQKSRAQSGDNVNYVLARMVRSNLQYNAAIEIGARGGG
ncbi:unnamed protein product, partial [Pylaiella littoralis]